MAVHTKTMTTYVCDMCGYSSSTEMDRGGAANVTISAGYMSYNGDVGGATTHEWWCGSCLHAYSDFKRERKINEQRGAR
jgi:protein-arginine kinase activator protein McsA